MVEKMTLEENQKLAEDVLKPLLKIIDASLGVFDIDRLKATHEAMRNKQRTVAAWPFQETMDKSELMKVMNDIFGGVLNLIELRINLLKIKKKQTHQTPGENVLSQLGLF